MLPSENEFPSRSKIIFVEIFCIILGIVDELLVKRIEFVRNIREMVTRDDTNVS